MQKNARCAASLKEINAKPTCDKNCRVGEPQNEKKEKKNEKSKKNQ